MSNITVGIGTIQSYNIGMCVNIDIQLSRNISTGINNGTQKSTNLAIESLINVD